ncbi:hypothetical protein DFP72DRAFT_1045104 [Ephemerocybe angulata]|uniref:Uncharacterized protein n=1 Tax=Ephemerocybe angulata TaxID=980116 RepID=A0A8H6I066_9AGAR|nr:hypothetical protein DFP72DRAFT_1045104 [Tulosesus angulatus]
MCIPLPTLHSSPSVSTTLPPFSSASSIPASSESPVRSDTPPPPSHPQHTPSTSASAFALWIRRVLHQGDGSSGAWYTARMSWTGEVQLVEEHVGRRLWTGHQCQREDEAGRGRTKTSGTIAVDRRGAHGASALWRLEGDLVEDDATVVEDETTLSVKESGRVVEDNDAFLSKVQTACKSEWGGVAWWKQVEWSCAPWSIQALPGIKGSAVAASSNEEWMGASFQSRQDTSCTCAGKPDQVHEQLQTHQGPVAQDSRRRKGILEVRKEWGIGCRKEWGRREVFSGIVRRGPAAACRMEDEDRMEKEEPGGMVIPRRERVSLRGFQRHFGSPLCQTHIIALPPTRAFAILLRPALSPVETLGCVAAHVGAGGFGRGASPGQRPRPSRLWNTIGGG